jgi:hypothetical protein
MIVEEKMEAGVIRPSKMTNERLCPGCGGAMAEVERVNENGFLFIWYECTLADCDGQWLEKKVANANMKG